MAVSRCFPFLEIDFKNYCCFVASRQSNSWNGSVFRLVLDVSGQGQEMVATLSGSDVIGLLARGPRLREEQSTMVPAEKAVSHAPARMVR